MYSTTYTFYLCTDVSEDIKASWFRKSDKSVESLWNVYRCFQFCYALKGVVSGNPFFSPLLTEKLNNLINLQKSYKLINRKYKLLPEHSGYLFVLIFPE